MDAAIAETGSLVFHSGPDLAVLGNFLPLHHLVLVALNQRLTASDLVNALPERDLAAILSTLGEEKRARSIARAIVARRAEAFGMRVVGIAGGLFQGRYSLNQGVAELGDGEGAP